MISWETFLYVFICGAMWMMSVVGLESAVVSPGLDRWNKRLFIDCFIVLVCGSTTFFFELIGYLNPTLGYLQVVAWYLQSLLYTFPLLMLLVFLLHCCGEDWRDSSLFRAMLVLYGVYFILLNIAQFTTPLLFDIDPSNQLNLGRAYPLLVSPSVLMLLLLAAGVIRRRSKLSREYLHVFRICLIPLTISMLIHLFTRVLLREGSLPGWQSRSDGRPLPPG